MYFFGAFENLLWDSLKDTHGPIWNSALMQGILPHAYKTIPSLLFGAHEFTTPPSLSDLASFCVDIQGKRNLMNQSNGPMERTGFLRRPTAI